MGVTRFLSGASLNLLSRAVLTSNPNVAPGFSLSDLVDGFPSSRVRFDSATEDGYIKADLQLLTNGNFDTWPGLIPDGWTNTSTGGQIIQESVVVHSGPYSVELNNGPDLDEVSSISQTVSVRAGEELTFEVWIKTNTNAIARVRIYNPRTDKYLTGGGTWSRGESDCLIQEGGIDWTKNSITFSVQDFATCLADKTPLQITLFLQDSIIRVAFFDDAVLFPSANHLSVHGHNLEPQVTLRWSSSTDGISYVTIKDLDPLRPAFWGDNVAKIQKRFHKFTIVGTPYADAVSIGELVLGQYGTLLDDAQHPFRSGWEWTRVQPQLRNLTPTGDIYARLRTESPTRALKLPYTHTTDASFDQFRQELLERSNYGADPIVLIPDDSKPDVIFGRIPDDYVDRIGPGLSWHKHQLMIVESPFAITGL